MSESVQGQQVGNRWVTPEEPKTSKYIGRAPHALRDWLGGTGGASDMMKVTKVLSVYSNRMDLASSISTFSAVGAVSRLPCATIDLCEKLVEAKKDGLTAILASKISHDTFEVGAMVAHVKSFFTPGDKVAGNAGIMLGAIADVFSVGTFSFELQETSRLLNTARGLNLSNDVQDGLSAKRTYSFMKLVKSVVSAVTGCFSFYALAAGVAVIGAGTALAVSLANTILNIGAHFYKNCYSDYFAKVGVVPLTA